MYIISNYILYNIYILMNKVLNKYKNFQINIYKRYFFLLILRYLFFIINIFILIKTIDNYIQYNINMTYITLNINNAF